MHRRAALGVLFVSSALARIAAADVVIPTVPIGNLGNAADASGFGSVNYGYQMSVSEVSATHYAAFLNAVAATDTFNLYNPSMASAAKGCRIIRNGSTGAFTYTVVAGYENRPVNFVSWGDAARFANWMHNGQPTGPQGTGTTETGSYTLNGIADSSLSTIARSAAATFVLPSEDEWYKSAYHRNDGNTGNYWLYATGTNTQPGKVLADPAGNNANYGPNPATPIDGTFFTTITGQFANSASPYGTFDQSGNVREWTEARPATGNNRFARGGSWFENAAGLQSGSRSSLPSGGNGQDYVGFRLAVVPSPSAAAVLGLGAFVASRRRRPAA
ncbi:MAG: formylglycine-generating enzyme family protein [Phycisphaerales bacterium]